MSTQERPLLEKLANALIPGQYERPGQDDTEPIAKVLTTLVMSRLERLSRRIPQDRQDSNNAIDNLVNTILEYVKNNKQLRDVYDKMNEAAAQIQGQSQDDQCPPPDNLRGVQLDSRASDFSDALNNLKKLYNALRSTRNIGSACHALLQALEPLLDTCYDAQKAGKLENALNELRNKLCSSTEGERNACDEFIGALCLLASTHLKLDKARWFNMLARAAVGDGNKYLPTCPWEGDAAAILYYLHYSGANVCKLAINNNGTNNNITGEKAVAVIVEKLLA